MESKFWQDLHVRIAFFSDVISSFLQNWDWTDRSRVYFKRVAQNPSKYGLTNDQLDKRRNFVRGVRQKIAAYRPSASSRSGASQATQREQLIGGRDRVAQEASLLKVNSFWISLKCITMADFSDCVGRLLLLCCVRKMMSLLEESSSGGRLLSVSRTRF
jgi:hypothetical protein